MAGFSKTGLSLVVGGSSAAVVAALMAMPASAVATPTAVGVAAVGVAAGKAPSTKVKVSLDVKSVTDSTAKFVGDVRGGPKAGMVILQRKTAAGKWRKVMSSDHTPGGFSVSYASQPGKYRAMVPLRTWYNHTRWYDKEKGWRWTGAAKAYSAVETVGGSGPADKPIKWVVGMGDSYASGEGATYAGYGPQNGTSQMFNTNDGWWISAFGNNLAETYPGDYEQPIAQPGLAGRVSDYQVELSGWQCHRSASAMMYWNDPEFAAVNLACSGATAYTNLNTGKPGIDRQDKESCYAGGAYCEEVIGQAEQLKKFAQHVVEKGDEIAVVSYSIGGNDVDFADIVQDCVERFVYKMRACSNPSSASGRTDGQSEMRKAYARGTGLSKATTAVVGAGTRIIKALQDAGVKARSYTLDLQTPVLGIPPANQFQKAFGGEFGWGRQGIGGCGFYDEDLDFVNEAFGELLRLRFTQGARQLQQENPGLKMVVTDATHAFNDHQLCSNRVKYPKSATWGDNTMTPIWEGDFGGAAGTWMTPIIALGVTYTGFPTLKKALQPPPDKKRISGDPISMDDDRKSLPMHPNFWGQRALASCHSKIATDASYIGKIVACKPSASGGLDSKGRPMMTTDIVQDISDAPQFMLKTRLSTESDWMCIGSGGGVHGWDLVLQKCGPTVQPGGVRVTNGPNQSMMIEGRCFDARGGIKKDTTMTLYPCHGGDNQRITTTQDGRLMVGKYCMGVQQNKFEVRNWIITWDCINEDGQRWEQVPIS